MTDNNNGKRYDCGIAQFSENNDIMQDKRAGTNCWEYLSCGREPGGSNADEMGVCPATTFEPADGFLGGKNGGRACVYIVGTFCSQVLKGTQRNKSKPCAICGFYTLLRREHGDEMSHPKFMDYIRKERPETFVMDGILSSSPKVKPESVSRTEKLKK